ncbi:hypothetical protein [Demequina sp. NBRC 110056]|nr:hypothetical protein [Demequina sp. NBRC 110056]
MSAELSSIALDAVAAVGGAWEATLITWSTLGIMVGGAALYVARRRLG